MDTDTDKLTPRESNGDAKTGKEDASKDSGPGRHGKKKQRIKRSKFRRYTPHVLVGVIVFATLRIVFNNVDVWPTPLQWHVILGVVGYQVLMGHGTLLIHTMAHKDFYFFPNTDKKILHWVITGLGSACAAASTYYMYVRKESLGKEHFNSTHGILGLVALILTGVSLLNGVVFYYWQELGIGKGNIKFLHTLTGLVTYVAATACLMYGYDKHNFHDWSSSTAAYGLMVACGLSVAYFSLSPGRILLNKLTAREHDEKRKEEKRG